MGRQSEEKKQRRFARNAARARKKQEQEYERGFGERSRRQFRWGLISAAAVGLAAILLPYNCNRVNQNTETQQPVPFQEVDEANKSELKLKDYILNRFPNTKQGHLVVLEHITYNCPACGPLGEQALELTTDLNLKYKLDIGFVKYLNNENSGAESGVRGYPDFDVFKKTENGYVMVTPSEIEIHDIFPLRRAVLSFGIGIEQVQQDLIYIQRLLERLDKPKTISFDRETKSFKVQTDLSDESDVDFEEGFTLNNNILNIARLTVGNVSDSIKTKRIKLEDCVDFFSLVKSGALDGDYKTYLDDENGEIDFKTIDEQGITLDEARRLYSFLSFYVDSGVVKNPDAKITDSMKSRLDNIKSRLYLENLLELEKEGKVQKGWTNIFDKHIKEREEIYQGIADNLDFTAVPKPTERLLRGWAEQSGRKVSFRDIPSKAQLERLAEERQIPNYGFEALLDAAERQRQQIEIFEKSDNVYFLPRDTPLPVLLKLLDQYKEGVILYRAVEHDVDGIKKIAKGFPIICLETSVNYSTLFGEYAHNDIAGFLTGLNKDTNWKPLIATYRGGSTNGEFVDVKYFIPSPDDSKPYSVNKKNLTLE